MGDNSGKLNGRLEVLANGFVRSALSLRQKDWPSLIGLYGWNEEDLALLKERMDSLFVEKGHKTEIVLEMKGYTIDVGYYAKNGYNPDVAYLFGDLTAENTPRIPNSFF